MIGNTMLLTIRDRSDRLQLTDADRCWHVTRVITGVGRRLLAGCQIQQLRLILVERPREEGIKKERAITGEVIERGIKRKRV